MNIPRVSPIKNDKRWSTLVHIHLNKTMLEREVSSCLTVVRQLQQIIRQQLCILPCNAKRH